MKWISEYISSITGNEVVMRKDRVAAKKLPLYITEIFSIYNLQLLGKNITLLYQNSGVSNTPKQLLQIGDIVKKAVGTTVLFAFDSIESYNKQRLVSKRINFVVKDKQIFIPSLLIDLSSKDTVIAKEIDSLTPLAQLIILYHLQIKSLDGYTTKEMAAIFSSSYITTNRALKSLEVLQVIKLDDGKEKKISFIHSAKELWNDCIKYLHTPIKNVVYTDAKISFADAKQSHINALAHYTMIAEEVGMQYAMTLDKLKELNIKTDAKFGENRIEIWRYAPELLSSNEYVDKLSLYLSLKDDVDVRVQIELEQLIEGNTLKYKL